MYVDRIMSFVDAPFVKILTGVRRCGKSTILKMVIERLKTELGVSPEHIITRNYDAVEYRDMSVKQMFSDLVDNLSSSGKTYLFLDEVQEITDWERVLNNLLQEYDVDIYITGSNSRMMSSEISTYLTGRYIRFPIYTLSFKEYLVFKNTYGKAGSAHNELFNYIRLGGFPATHLREYSDDEVYTIVKDIYNSTVLVDIVRRGQIRKVDQLEHIVKYVFNNVGNTFSAKTISSYLKSERRSMDSETVYSYLENLEKAYLLCRCLRYDLQGKEILKTQEKYYVSDTALRYSVLGFSEDSVASSLENIVYLELCRRGYSVNIGNIGSGEVDFIAVLRACLVSLQQWKKEV